MGSALEAVLSLKANQQAQEQQRSENLSQGLQMLAQAKQQAITNNMAQMQYKAGLAERGLVPDESTPSGFRFDASTMNPFQQILTGTKLQADAKTAGNKQIYDLAGKMLNSLPGQQQSIPQSSPIPTGSPIGQVIGTPQSAAPLSSPVTSGQNSVMTPTGQTSQTDPITGLTTGTTTSTNIPADVAKANAIELGREQVSGQKAVAVDKTLTDSLTQHMLGRSRSYATAFNGGMAGGQGQVFAGQKLGQEPLLSGMENIYDPKAVTAASDFDSSTNGMVARAQQYFASQVGTGASSTRLFTTVIDMLKQEFGTRKDSPVSLMGRNSGTTRTMYILGKAGQEYLDNLSPEQKIALQNNTMPDSQVKGIAQDIASKVNNFTLSKEDESNIKKQTELVNAPLQEILNRKKLGNKATKYIVGQVITQGNKNYRITGGDLNNDPDVEVIK